MGWITRDDERPPDEEGLRHSNSSTSNEHQTKWNSVKTNLTGDMYINIGTGKSCFFVRMSSFLMRKLDQYPLLYRAIEEGLQCAKDGYYAAGIMAFSQLLNILQQMTPDARHKIAHELLKTRPSIDDFNKILEMVKTAANGRYQTELRKTKDPTLYHQCLVNDWKKLMSRLLKETRPVAP